MDGERMETLRSWCITQIGTLRDRISLIEKRDLRHYSQSGARPFFETTTDGLQSDKAALKRVIEMVAMIDADRARDRQRLEMMTE